MKLKHEQLERVAILFRALAEPTRLGILQELKAGELTVSEIVNAMPTSQANVSKQLKILRDAGLIERRKQGTQVFYQIHDELVFQLCQLVCEKLNRSTKRKRLQF